MQHMKLKLAATVTAALLSTTAMADSWVVTQETKLGTDTTVTQDAAGTSTQALNAVNTETGIATGAFITGTQTATPATGKDFTLTQTNGTAGSTQAANSAKAAKIDPTAGGVKFTQTYGGDKDILLNQTSALTGASNKQAFNAAEGGDINGLQQDVGAGAKNVTLTQSNAVNNTQSVNTVIGAETLGGTIQEVLPTVKLELQQTAGTGTQAANNVVATSIDGALTQTVTAGSAATLVNQKTTGASATQALNMTTVGTGSAAITQNVNGVTTMTQGATGAAPGASNVQAGNYVKSSGVATSISSLDQNFGSTDKAVSLTQTEAVTGTAQAGNMIDMASTTGALTSATQDIDTGNAAIGLSQTGSASGSTQAGNLIKTSSGAAAAVTSAPQTITTTGTLTMAQSSTNTALQAGNAIITQVANGGGAANQLVDVGTLTQSQTSTTGSFQAENYLGEAL